MKKKTIAIIFGGCSSEYEVSLQSAYSVIISLNLEYYDVILIGITRSGVWMRYDGSPEQIRDNTWMDIGACVPAIISPDRHIHGMLEFYDDKIIATRIDVVFPVLHGKNGEDGTVQGLLTMAGIPFVGCGTLSSAMCMDKDIAHKIVHLAGVKTPPSILLRSKISDAELMERIVPLKFPMFVKPVSGGSSLGITKVSQGSELQVAIAVAFQYDNKILIEEAINGFEVGCAVLGNDSLTIGEVDEIELSNGFNDYIEKYTPKTSQIHMPARIDADMAVRIKRTSVIIYQALRCSGFARVDLFLTPDRDIIFNEVNTIPGFTSHSRYPNMLKGIGMTFDKIVDSLIMLEMRR
ncbi:D-alanine--D-serine ligase VanG [Clostridium estertheticum]|uniref:D-alanine--D-serine ligase VanG n=1 Tax=Clostridium estertheticum TaxID=238834 RepID=UPI0013EEE862|nr:D-alanine--D-serine ligase VanG [Clostridium estertheticum]MBZ9609632.1 D-alanine--D-serine ligase VanG [Clostridium estertheticum]